jgi:hypothetical protein
MKKFSVETGLERTTPFEMRAAEKPILAFTDYHKLAGAEVHLVCSLSFDRD